VEKRKKGKEKNAKIYNLFEQKTENEDVKDRMREKESEREIQTDRHRRTDKQKER
jgi:hypothetical protein